MFTGIVTEQGVVSSVKSNRGYSSISIKCSKKFLKGLKKGASVAVNGVCLTSKKGSSEMLQFDVIDETLARTNLKLLKKNSLVNLERSITASTEIGGHLMSGHIHFTGKVKEIISKENTKDFIIGFPKKFKQYILEKGYIGVNGCSLTIGKVKNNSFNLHLIPETLSITNLKDLVKGDLVNIEIDQNTIAIVETVKNYLTAQKSR